LNLFKKSTWNFPCSVCKRFEGFNWEVCVLSVLICPFYVLSLIPNYDSRVYNNELITEFYFLLYFCCFVVFCFARILYVSLKKARFRCTFNRVDFLVLFLLLCNVLNKLCIGGKESLLEHDTNIFLSCFAIYFLLKTVLLTVETDKLNSVYGGLRKLIMSVLCISLAIGLLQLTGVLESRNPYFRISGQFLNPARYMMFCALLFPYLLISKNDIFGFPNGKNIFYAGIALFLIVLSASTIQTVWISTILIGGFFVCKTRFSSRLSKLYVLMLSVIAISAIILTMSSSESARGRMLIWKISGNMISDHFFFGIGVSNFSNIYNIYQGSYFANHAFSNHEMWLADVVRHPYNEMLKIICEQGFFGFVVVLLAFYHLLKYAIPMMGKEAIRSFHGANCLSLLSFCIVGLFSYPTGDISVVSVALLSLCFLSRGIGGHKFTVVLDIRKMVVTVVPLLLLFGSEVKTMWKKHTAYSVWKNGSAYYLDADKADSLYVFLKDDTRFVLWYTGILLEEKRHQDVVQVVKSNRSIIPTPQLYIILYKAYSAMCLFEQAEQALMKAVNIVPNRFEARYHLVTHYLDRNEFEKCRGQAIYILDMPVKVGSQGVSEIKRKTMKILEEIEQQQERSPSWKSETNQPILEKREYRLQTRFGKKDKFGLF